VNRWYFHLFACTPSGVINYLDITSIIALPSKTETPLVIDPNTGLTVAISVEHFEGIGWRQ